MSGESPDVVLYDFDGYSLAVRDGVAIPAFTPALLHAGSDGTNSRYMLVDSSGRQIMVGAGTAGTPAGGIISIQGVGGGTAITVSGTLTANIGTTNGLALDATLAKLTIAQGTSLGSNTQVLVGGSVTTSAPTYTTGQISPFSLTTAGAIRIDGSGVTQPVSGTVTANAGTGTFNVAGTVTANAGTGNFNNSSIGTTGSAVPASASYSGFSDGTNLQGARVFDVDSGAGAQYVQGVNLRLSASGGSVEFGTNTNPIRIDPTGATTQPVSGTVTANAGTGNFTVVQATASNLLANVGGLGASGAAVSGNPVRIGGSDGTNTRDILTDTSGRQIVIGAAANGAAVAGNPVLIAGSDGANARSIRTATDGTVRVDPTGTTTQPVSGTVTANIGTTNGLALDATLAKLTIAQGASLGTNTQALVGGSVTTAAPTYTTGQISPISLTTAGAVRIDGSGTTQPVSGTVTSNQGTAAALSGAWPVKVTDGTNTMPTGDAVGRAIFEKITDGTNTAAVKAASTAAAAADPSLVVGLSPNSPLPTGSNVIGAVTQSAGPWTENLTQIAGSAVSTSATGVQKVGVVGNAGATTDATLTAGTAPANGYGTLAQYNTSQPAPTNTQTVGIQSDQSANLLQFPGVQTKTGAAWTSATTINTLQFPTGTTTVGAPIGALAILVQLDQTTTITAGAVTFQGTYDGTNWVSVPTAQLLHPQTLAQLTNPYTFVANTNQPFLIQLQGFQQVRLNLTSTITGTGSVTPFWTVLSNTPAQAVTMPSGAFGGQIEGRSADGAAPVGNPVLVAGYDGTNTQTILTDTLGRIITAPAGAATTSGFAFGDVALSSVTTVTVRRTTYTEQSVNAQRSFTSSSANDTNSAGTGARQVKITYYDSTGAGPNTETVNLNGTAAVATSNSNICFIEKMEVVSVGSGGVNAGTITLFVNNAGGGGTIGTIAIGDNRTFWAHHYTPTGKTTFITSVSAVINGGAGIYVLKAKTIGVATAPEAQISDFIRESAQAAVATRNYGTAIPVVGPSRIIMYVTTEANTSLTYRGAFDFYDQ